MTVQMDRSAPSSRELVQGLFRKNIELENGLRKSAQSKVPSDPNAWFQMRENYETIIVEDHEFSEKHDVEYVLWQLHYRRIEEFRQHINAAASAGSNASSGGKVPVRPDKVKKIRSVFKSFLMEATGFYHDLILKIRAKYGLPLSYFNEGTENEIVLTKDEKKLAEIKKGLMSCHRCLIYLGDLARYKGLYGEGDSISCDYSAASSYYMQAVSLCPSSGNPHHQLAILASYSGDELLAVYRYFRSLAVEIPFLTARDNLIIAFEKNRQSYSQLPSNMRMTSVRSLPGHSAGRGRGRGNSKLLAKDTKLETTPTKEQEVTVSEVFKAFSIRFVRLHGVLFTRTSLETFEEVFSTLINDLRVLLSSGPELELNFGPDPAENASVILRLIAILIFTVHNVKRDSENQSYAEILQRSVLLQNAFTAAFEFTGYILKRCLEQQDVVSSYLLPSILVFIEWLACHPDISAGADVGEKQAGARSFFWNQCVPFMNKLILTGLASIDGDEDETCFSNMSSYDEGETGNRLALWEDFELRGFSPSVPAHIILDFSQKHSYGNDGGKGKISRVRRILAAGQVLAKIVSVDQQQIFVDPTLKKFVLGTELPVFDNHMASTLSVALDSTAMKEGSQSENAGLGLVVPSASTHGVKQTKTHLYIEGEEEEEEIVFKPTVSEKYPDVTAFDLANHVQASSASDWMNAQHLSVPFDSVQMSAVSNGNLTVHPSANTISQLPLQYIDSDTSRWFMNQEALLSDALVHMNISGNGYLNKQMLQESSAKLQPSLFSPAFHSPVNLNANSTPSNQINSMNATFSSPLDTLVPSGASSGVSAALPALKRNPVSRPVRHIGPPPGFAHISYKKQNEANSNSFPKEQQHVIDDYSWLDDYQSSSTKSMEMDKDNSLNVIMHRQPYASMSSNTAFANSSSFPFPGKQVSSAQNHVVDEQKWLDFQLFEQLRAHSSSGQKLERSSPQHTLQPEHHRS